MNWHVPSYATAAAVSTASARTQRAPQLFALISGATDRFEEQSLRSIRAGPEIHGIS
jgi:hypothetical protein